MCSEPLPSVRYKARPGDNKMKPQFVSNAMGNWEGEKEREREGDCLADGRNSTNAPDFRKNHLCFYFILQFYSTH